MKKIFWSLAALMLMAAPVMTSCSNDLEEVAPAEEVKDNVVTLTIKMPVQAETRVGIDDGTLKLTGWEKNDVVKVYHFEYPEGLSEGVTFTCTDAAEGTFTGTLPADKTLDDYNFAVYGRDVMYNTSISDYVVFPANDVHDNLKDCICLAGPLDNGSCTMTIYNNVIKVTNHKAPVTGVWKDSHNDNMKLYGSLVDKLSFAPGHHYISSTFNEAKITIPTGVSYIFMPRLKGENMGFFAENGTSIIPEKTFTNVVGKLYNVTLGTPTTGQQNTIVNMHNYKMQWVQLWEDGPKFAFCNLGFGYNDPSAEMLGGYYTWGGSIDQDPSAVYNTGTEALSGGNDPVTELWGDTWRMPTKDELEGLLTNCDSEWTTVDGVYGRKFTGRGDDYSPNSIFLPAAGFYSEEDVHSPGTGFYLSSTPSGNDKAFYLLFNENDPLRVITGVRNYGYSIRPVRTDVK